jgi:hypothetical protein
MTVLVQLLARGKDYTQMRSDVKLDAKVPRRAALPLPFGRSAIWTASRPSEA